jgi:DtxR family Mn-dependent transcriptional regulator
MQDYMKTIYQLSRGNNRVTTNVLAERLGVTAASVTGMLKKLADMKLVEYEPYQGVVLTLSGQKVALEVLRHHRLMELYLTEALGYSWDRVHQEAERLEHAISPEFADKVSALLGDPQRDPHGSPIPTKDGIMAATSKVALSDVPEGRTVQVERVTDERPAVLRHLAEVGLVPGKSVTVLTRDAEQQMLSFSLRGLDPAAEAGAASVAEPQPRAISFALASHIYIIEEP